VYTKTDRFQLKLQEYATMHRQLLTGSVKRGHAEKSIIDPIRKPLRSEQGVLFERKKSKIVSREK
jgi:hypothetical protein